MTDPVPFREPTIEKVFFSISEVAEMLNVNASLIRFWEKEFTFMKPRKNRKGNRMYTREDIDQLKVIYHLVKERGMTLKGAHSLLRKNREGTAKTAEVAGRLMTIRQQLVDIRDQLADE